MTSNLAPRARTLTIVLLSACGFLLLTVVALVFLFIGRAVGDDHLTGQPRSTVTPAPTQTVTPTPTQTVQTVAPTAAPPVPVPVNRSTRFTSFVAPTTVKCIADSDTKPLIRVSWSSAYAVSAWYTANGGDAANDRYMQIPLSGNQDSFTDEHLFDCFHRPTQAYTLTLVAPNGTHVSKQWTVTNVGEQ